ncbi:hypothetical protein G7Z17_g886 [Cylindrodendrum hubeiense]|uniref:Uncharacterized protein n=1 Tax=Cylindrodendrum hubeiense TaxID=595255 RepID=A0A9P5HMH8_9HYPO|nr:hypothetical protein G7Z17_g886 [Cylindrodendrum hubeiense]
MCAQKASEWTELGISAWTKFRVNSDPIDDTIFEPLTPWRHYIRTPFYGRIVESPHDCFLAVGWESPKVYDEFKRSPQYEKLMANLGANSMDPQTHIIVFSNTMFGYGSGPNTEILTAYWPKSISPETQEAVWNAKDLVHTPASGIPNPRCYREPPTFGWLDGVQTWNEENVLASVWCHNWVNKELEQKFKRTDKRIVYLDGHVAYPLALDDFENALKALGVLGWQSVHVDFEHVSIIYEDALSRKNRLQKKLDEAIDRLGSL